MESGSTPAFSAFRIAARLARHQSSGSCSAHVVRGDANGACSSVADASTRPSWLTTTTREPDVPTSIPRTDSHCECARRLLRSAESLFHMSQRIGAMLIVLATLCAPASVFGQGRGAGESPASKKPPSTATPQTYPPEQIQAGETRFISQCGFCHGRDAGGGEAGPDLTGRHSSRKTCAATRLDPSSARGAPTKECPDRISAMPTSRRWWRSFTMRRRKPRPRAEAADQWTSSDLQTGNAEAGRRYFNGAGGCAKCHAITGDFAKVGARYEGLALLHRLLYPGSGRGAGPAPAPPTATVTTADGKAVIGKVTHHDEFTISITDANGWTRSWPVKQVRIAIDNPIQAHIDQLGKYSDEDMHNVFAYLQTLK